LSSKSQTFKKLKILHLHMV